VNGIVVIRVNTHRRSTNVDIIAAMCCVVGVCVAGMVAMARVKSGWRETRATSSKLWWREKSISCAPSWTRVWTPPCLTLRWGCVSLSLCQLVSFSLCLSLCLFKCWVKQVQCISHSNTHTWRYIHTYTFYTRTYKHIYTRTCIHA
jgi:hypothetical protein